eukprot:14747036-Heterocapsa_arctica.AAC.1
MRRRRSSCRASRSRSTPRSSGCWLSHRRSLISALRPRLGCHRCQRRSSMTPDGQLSVPRSTRQK